jgi:hypothetical protein
MDVNPHNLGSPVWKGDQVITNIDLMSFIISYKLVLKYIKWWDIKNRVIFSMKLIFVNELLSWLMHGKPSTSAKIGILFSKEKEQ